MSEQKLIANRYQMGELIGQGGMGAVYKATDTRSGATVAIKVLMQDLIANVGNEAIERFRREVEALRRLDHPNIIKLLGTAREGNQYYIVMEYAGGGSLAQLLTKEGRMAQERALHMALDIGDALTRAHRVGIVHRDIKPDNVLLTSDGTIRLTDFGVARIGDRTQLTRSGYIVGTGSYLSPEACRGQELDSRADIWAFGILLFEMLTGQRPFDGNNPAAVITAILLNPLPSVLDFRPDLPEPLAHLINHMLQKDRDHRIPTARQVGAKLELILSGDTSASASPVYTAPVVANSRALETLIEKWAQIARESVSESGSLRGTNSHQAYYHRGVATAYRDAIADLQAAIAQPDDDDDPTVPQQQDSSTQLFVQVTRENLDKVLKRARLKSTNIYEDKGFIFTVVFPRMPPVPMEERIRRMTAACDDIIILESGSLRETQEPYIDFGFTAQPDVR